MTTVSHTKSNLRSIAEVLLLSLSDEILKCWHLIESYWAVLLFSAVCCDIWQNEINSFDCCNVGPSFVVVDRVQIYTVNKWSCVLSAGIYPTGKSYIRGWITDFLEPRRCPFEPGDFTSGLVTVPITMNHPSGVQDTAALVAGMLGFTVHRTTTSDEVTVQPFQGWSLMLAEDSPFV